MRKLALNLVSEGRFARSAFISLWVRFPWLDSKACELPLDVCNFFNDDDCFNFDFDKELLAWRADVNFGGIKGFLLSGCFGGNIVAPDD